MGFPKLSEVSMYPITIPSSGIQTRFRPYLVKEEKILLVASEQNDPDLINQSFFTMIVVYPILLLYFSRKYKWGSWKDKLTGKVN